jgi:general secretion pathway protein E
MDARGCDECGHTGYRGRMAVVEYLRCDEGIKALDVGPHFLAEAREYCRSQGWRSLREDGYLKALRGLTTLEEVLRVAG